MEMSPKMMARFGVALEGYEPGASIAKVPKDGRWMLEGLPANARMLKGSCRFCYLRQEDASVLGGGGEDADPTLILRSMEFGRVIAEIHLREKAEGSVNEEVEDAVHGR